MGIPITSIGTPIIKIRWSDDHLIFIIGVLASRKMTFILEKGPDIDVPLCGNLAQHHRLLESSWSAQVHQTEGLAQDCSNSSALAMELLQSCAKP